MANISKYLKDFIATLKPVATSGSYTDLINKPTISTAGASGSYTDLINKPTISTAGASGSYTDLINKPVDASSAKQIILSNNSSDINNDIDFADGTFNFSDRSGSASLSAITKRLDANWVAGTNQGGLDTGSKANSTWYYCYAIYNPTTQVSDVIFSANSSSPTLPSGFTKYKYIGAVLTNSSGNITPFKQLKNYFEYESAIQSFYQYTSSGITSGAYYTYTLDVPRKNNIVAKFFINARYEAGGVVDVLYNWRRTGSSGSSWFGGGTRSGYSSNPQINNFSVNSSAQLDIAWNFGDVNNTRNFVIQTFGFIDYDL